MRLSHLEKYGQPVSRMRIQQAIERHPDLRSLLEPLLAEIDSHFADVKKVKELLKNVKDLIE